MRALLTALALLAVAACVPASDPSRGAAGDAPPWRLASAVATADDRHLIVTVAPETPEALTATAEALSADHPIDLVAEWPLSAIAVHCFVFRVSSGQEVATVVAALDRDRRVRTVQVMRRFETATALADTDLAPLQDAFAAMEIGRMHRIASGRGVRIGVIDTSVDADHPDLAPSITAARDFVADGGGVGPETHGTAVAGVIAAEARSGRGITGIAPDARIASLRACWETVPGGQGTCSSFSLARALNFALSADLDVVNMSVGGPEDPLIGELLAVAEAEGLLVVAPHSEDRARSYPGSQPSVVAVGPAGPATAGVVRAPAEDVLTTAPGQAYDFLSGASIASAHVTGVAALLLELEPESTAADLRTALRDAAPVGLEACAALTVLSASRSCP